MRPQPRSELLNVDIDLVATSNMATIVAALSAGLFPVRVTDTEATLELRTAERSVEDIVSLVFAMIGEGPGEMHDAWHSCERRTMNVGIQAGFEPHEHLTHLSPRCLVQLVMLRAGLTITVYAATPRPPR